MKKLFLSAILSLCMVFATTPLMAAMPFNDVKTSDWFYDEVQFVYDNSIFEGVSPYAFSPNTEMTRAMFVTVLGRMSNVDVTQYSSCHFADVEAGSWYAPYVQWAYEEGITKGITSDCFGAYQPVTREQMAKFIMDYASYAGLHFTQVSPGYYFSDEWLFSDWSGQYIYDCQKYGLLNGKDWNEFDPKSGSTRAEVATLIHRVRRAEAGERIVVNYPYTNIPTYDSVVLDFCEMSGYYDVDYFELGFFEGADLMIYQYDQGNFEKYKNYLTEVGFWIATTNYTDGATTYLLERGNDRMMIGAPIDVAGYKYVAVYILDMYEDDI